MLLTLISFCGVLHVLQNSKSQGTVDDWFSKLSQERRELIQQLVHEKDMRLADVRNRCIIDTLSSFFASL